MALLLSENCMPNQTVQYKALSYSAVIIMIGIITSGPIGSYIAQQYNFQSAPFYFGFVLMFGILLFFASIPPQKNEWERINSKLVIFFAGIYTCIISLNYLLQIALVPKIISEPNLTEMLSVSNSNSFFWDLEMTGYGFLGLATLSASTFFHNGKKQEMIRLMCIINGIISILGAILTFVFDGWVLSNAGLLCYLIWNIVIMLLAVYLILEYRFGKRIITHITPYEKQ